MKHISSHHWKRTVKLVNNFVSVATANCPIGGCASQKVQSLKELSAHIASYHFANNQTVSCPFKNCNYEYNIASSYASHVSRHHSTASLLDIKGNDATLPDPGPSVDRNEDVQIKQELEDDISYGDIDEGADWENFCSGETLNISESEEASFIKSVGNLFNKLGCIHNVPFKTVKVIVESYFELYRLGKDLLVSKVSASLRDEEVNEDIINQVIEILTCHETDSIFKAEDQLGTEAKRKHFIENNFVFVQPRTQILNPEKEVKRDTYQYIPINDSLKYLLEDPTYLEQKLRDPWVRKEGVIEDYRDSFSYKNNVFFKRNPEAIPLIIYFDDVEICNPLGRVPKLYPLCRCLSVCT